MSDPSPDRAVAILAIAAFASATSTRAADALLPLLAAEFGTTPGGAAAVITEFALSYGPFLVAALGLPVLAFGFGRRLLQRPKASGKT